MEIKPHKQSLTVSCLAASLLMTLQEKKDIKFGEKEEQEMALLGSRRTYPFYVVGITAEIAKKYKCNIKVLVDNKYFAGILKKAFADQKTISVEPQSITIKLIREALEKGSVVCHIDDHALGDYSHASHFIVIEKAGKGMFTIVDPWYGGRKRISEKKLEIAISELKKHIKMCPLLFVME